MSGQHTSAPGAELAEAFRRLQAGDGAAALEIARRIVAASPSNARAHLAAGIALRLLGRAGESLAEIEAAARLDPHDYGAAYERGVSLELHGDADAAIESFARAVKLRTAFVPARLALARALWARGRHEEARAQFIEAATAAPGDAEAHAAYGRFCVARGEWEVASEAFRRARSLAPQRRELSMYLAQVELLRGRWREAWEPYGLREPRAQLEARLSAQGRRYRVPRLDELRGREVQVVREQGLGDELFFLRFAPRLAAAGARVIYHAEPRLVALAQRAGVFDDVRAYEERQPPPEGMLLLSGDLPALAMGDEPIAPSLRIAPRAAALEEVRGRFMRAGPQPWIAVTWRAGTRGAAHALSKQAPLEALFAALAPVRGTLLALQRGLREGEIEAAARAAGRAVHDFSAVGEDLELALAAVTLADRHIGVSSTNMHLAAAAGATARALVPFPPEWRWGVQGASPWFPGFGVLRQDRGGDWSAALAALSGADGNTSRA